MTKNIKHTTHLYTLNKLHNSIHNVHTVLMKMQTIMHHIHKSQLNVGKSNLKLQPVDICSTMNNLSAGQLLGNDVNVHPKFLAADSSSSFKIPSKVIKLLQREVSDSSVYV